MPLAEALSRARADGRPIVVPYLMVDRARRRALRPTVRALRDGGATALELGFPFSDPIADGPVLEAAHERALHDGTKWSELLRALRTVHPVLPTAVMIYANPLVHRGLDSSIRELATAGATGLIVPDLSWEESAPFRAASRRAGLALVLLAAPGMSTDRLALVARSSRGFLYLVSHYGTTGGVARGSTVDLRPLVRSARRAAPELPVLVGFGVRDRPSAERALASGADGVIVGTALEEQLRRGARPSSLIRFLGAIAEARRPSRAAAE
ncbi:MAG: tryptophan synthase subunit alpha [Thermoplasmata archaeon]